MRLFRAKIWDSVRLPAGRKLFLASFLSLYFELALIRWIPGTVHIVGFFTNLVLIASFLGLGLGMARSAPATASVWRFLFRLAVLAALLAIVHIVSPEVSLPNGADYGINEAVVNVGIGIPLPLVLIGVFALTTWATMPLGQLVAAHFDELERIQAYSINIAGSLLGVIAFSVVAWRSFPPEAWFAIGIGLVLLLDRRKSHAIPILLLAGVLLALLINDSDGFRNDVRWSPYYKVVTRPVVDGGKLSDGFVTDVNGQFLLSGLDLRPEAQLPGNATAEVRDEVAMLKTYYALPFQLRRARRVLVMGAGAGNDVAAALRSGVDSVTAVEIDPLVLGLGERYHPEHPFRSPRVTPVLNDARAFLNRTKERFDLIIFATLDAHGLLSGAANVRLDSFVYTRESIRAAKEHLSKDGILVLSFGPFREDIQLRQYEMVRSVFGRDPIYLLHRNRHRTIVSGAIDGLRVDPLPADWTRITTDEVARDLVRYPYAAIPATDDWPHLYIRHRRVPSEYFGVFAGILAISLVLVRRTFRGTRRINGQFFFLGAGFLLMETKSVTQYALLVGSTWQTNSLVFSVILATILLANVLVMVRLRRANIPLMYGLMLVALFVSFLWPIARWRLAPGVPAYTAAAGYLGIPILIAAVIFASEFRRARVGTEALASNLLGAVLGGTLEYLSLAWGIRSLSLVAAGMYLAAFAAWARSHHRAETPAEPADVAAPAYATGG
jgi:spermine/spermidine synthase